MTNKSKQISKGDNSPNINAETYIATYNSVPNSVPTKRIRKNRLGNIVKILIDSYVEPTYELLDIDNQSLPVEDLVKIEYNEIPIYSTKFFLIANVESVEMLDSVLNTLENPSDLKNATRVVIKAFNETRGDLENFNSLTQKEKKYDNILLKTQEKLFKSVENSYRCDMEDITEIEDALCLLIYYVFRHCRILDKPTPDYIESYHKGGK
ncbi:MAG: hypothetical protein RR557_08050 [Bacilli bacterium]